MRRAVLIAALLCPLFWCSATDAAQTSLALSLVVDAGFPSWSKPVSSAADPGEFYSATIRCGKLPRCEGYIMDAPATGAAESEALSVQETAPGVLAVSGQYQVRCPGDKSPRTPAPPTLTLRLTERGAVLEGCGEPISMTRWEGSSAWRSRALTTLSEGVVRSSGLQASLKGCEPFSVACVPDQIGVACRTAPAGWLMLWPDGNDYRLRKVPGDSSETQGAARAPLSKCALDTIFIGGWKP